MAERATTDLVGAYLGGRYQVRRLLGEGGMGAVYLALDEALNKEVALKLVHRSSTKAMERLRDEVLLAQRVTHRNVCRTYDLEEVDGLTLVKMELVGGETLSRRLEAGRRPVDEALDIARQVVAGLEAAHGEGVVHCDLKPQNIMIEHGSGRVVLMDFGIARAAFDESAGAETSSGTPEYMAPEQAKQRVVDGRTDLYALGCVLYHMLVGEVPFPATTRMAATLRHLMDAVPDPRAKRAELPPWLARLVMQLMAKDPEARLPDAPSLQRALAGPRRRDWRRLGAAVSVGVLVLAGAIALAYRQAARRHGFRAQVHERLPSYEENADTPVISPDGKWLAYTCDRDGSWRVHVEPLAAGGTARAITPQGQLAMLPHWTHDGAALLFSDGQRHVSRVAREGGGAPVLVAGGADEADDCAGRLVIHYFGAPDCPSCRRLVIRDGLDVGAPERELLRLPAGRSLLQLRCDRQGKQVAYASGVEDNRGIHRPSDVWVVALDGGAPARALTDDHLQNNYPTFAADGRSVIFSSARGGNTTLWEVPVGGGPARAITTGEGPDLASDVSPDGQLLLYDNDVTSVPLYAWQIAQRARRKITRTLDDVARPQPSPDGREVIASVQRHGKVYVVAYPLVDDAVERVLAEGDSAALTVDGADVAYTVAATGGGGARLMVLPRTGGGAARLVAELPGDVLSVNVDSERVVHLQLITAAGYVTRRVPLAGGPLVEDAPAPWHYVYPAPTGGWRALLRAKKGTSLSEAHFFPPGAPAATAAPAPGVPLDIRRLAWDSDGRSVVYWNGTEVRRHRLTGGPDDLLLPLKDCNSLAVSPDGNTIYFSETLGHVRRQLITNFASR